MMRLSIRSLRKVYQDGNVALADFNLELDNGVYGLLGPNGAGKSTLLEILSLNLMQTSGQIQWEGQDIHQRSRHFRRAIGYLPQTYGFYPELNARQMLSYLGRLHGLRGRALKSRIAQCLAEVRLEEFRRRKIKTFSGGMRQRLAIAQALLHSPPLLIIDEPTTGLDPEERVSFRNMLFDLEHSGIILLSTHIVKDVEFSCRQMTLLFAGEQSYTGPPVDFIERVAGRVFETEVPLDHFEEFAKIHHVVAIHEHGESISVRFITPEQSSTDVPESQPMKANLEDAYVDFMRQQRQEVSLAETE
ncbi:ATP-binding cassette domain-containing protein [Candidatus Sumerlaeota bacterium]